MNMNPTVTLNVTIVVHCHRRNQPFLLKIEILWNIIFLLIVPGILRILPLSYNTRCPIHYTAFRVSVGSTFVTEQFLSNVYEAKACALNDALQSSSQTLSSIYPPKTSQKYSFSRNTPKKINTCRKYHQKCGRIGGHLEIAWPRCISQRHKGK